MLRTMPDVSVRPDVVALSGGLDLVSSSLQAPSGAMRGAINYEPVFGGGVQSLGGIERFSGQPRPSDATYTILPAAVPGIYPPPGATVTGSVSGATARVIVTHSSYIVVTKVIGAFGASEVLTSPGYGGGTFGSAFAYPAVTPDMDNAWSTLAANVYRADIAAVPGAGPIRGLAILGSSVYAWRDTASGTAMAIYRSTSSGWALVPMYTELGFTSGAVAPAEGALLSKGGVSATVKRVVLESGSWSGATAAGRLIVTTPSGGAFTAGAVTGTATLTLAATLPGALVQSAITLAPGGRVQTDAGNFTASLQTRRLYGCDGVNREFEFDGDVLVPLKTGMNARANAVKVHKNHLFFCFNGSIQCSGIGQPYAWTPIFGAAELGTGDTGVGFVTVAGSESQGALIVLCANSTFVLYGNSSADWNLIPLSTQRGALPYSVQEFAGVPFAYDTPGFVAFSPTQTFGNYQTDVVSRSVEQVARNLTPTVSVVNKNLVRYRCFFSDGTALVCGPSPNGYRWATLEYGKTITAATSDEIANTMRVFYGDDTGMVYEADVGRSLDGEPIGCFIKLAALSQGSPVTEKAYRGAWVETKGQGAFSLSGIAEFDDSDPQVDPSLLSARTLFGSGGIWDQSQWDAAFFDAQQYGRSRFDFEGSGYNVAPIFSSVSATQLPHEIATLTFLYTPRRMAR
jgi:hypothetical protein